MIAPLRWAVRHTLVVLIFVVMFSAVLWWWFNSTPRRPVDQLTEQQRVLVNQELYAVLQLIPDAILARVSVIRTVPVSDSDVPLVQFSVVAAAAPVWYAPGPGPLFSGKSIASWKFYIDRLLAGQCAHVTVDDISTPLVSHLRTMGVKEFDACPLHDSDHALAGALFISWSKDFPPATPEHHFPVIQTAADRIAGLLRTRKDTARRGY